MTAFALLPPANEVWGKVMFSEACVSHSVHRECVCMMSLPVWLPGPMFFLGGPLPGPMFLPGVPMSKGVSGDGGLCLGMGGFCPAGVSVQEGSLSRKVYVKGGFLYRDPRRIRNAGDMHPRGMLSSFVLIWHFN